VKDQLRKEALASCSNGICGVPTGVRSSLSVNASALTFQNDMRGCHFENDDVGGKIYHFQWLFFKMTCPRVILILHERILARGAGERAELFLKCHPGVSF
jgi:hypothetical protein